MSKGGRAGEGTGQAPQAPGNAGQTPATCIKLHVRLAVQPHHVEKCERTVSAEHHEQWVRERAQKQAQMVSCVGAPSEEAPKEICVRVMGALATRDRRRTSRPCGDENRP